MSPRKITANVLANQAWADAYLASMDAARARGMPESLVHEQAGFAAAQSQRLWIQRNLLFPIPPKSILLSVVTLGAYGAVRRLYVMTRIARREKRLGITIAPRRKSS